MKKIMIWALSLTTLVLQHSLFAQANPEPMKKLELMVGQWEGNATQNDQTGSHKIRQTEDVKFMLDGDILVIKGTGYDAETDKLSFEAFGVIHWDAQAGEYKFNAYSMGRHVMAHANFEGDNFVWWFDTPGGGTVRYTIQLTDTTWIEDGAFSQDGTQWHPFFHMELTKK